MGSGFHPGEQHRSPDDLFPGHIRQPAQGRFDLSAETFRQPKGELPFLESILAADKIPGTIKSLLARGKTGEAEGIFTALVRETLEAGENSRERMISLLERSAAFFLLPARGLLPSSDADKQTSLRVWEKYCRVVSDYCGPGDPRYGSGLHALWKAQLCCGEEGAALRTATFGREILNSSAARGNAAIAGEFTAYLAENALRQGRVSDAVELYREAVPILTEELAATDSRQYKVAAGYARAMQRAGQADEALDFLSTWQKRALAFNGPNSRTTLAVTGQLIEQMADCGLSAQACQELDKLDQLRGTLTRYTDKLLRQPLAQLALLCIDQGKIETAMPIAHRAIEAAQAASGKEQALSPLALSRELQLRAEVQFMEGPPSQHSQARQMLEQAVRVSTEIEDRREAVREAARCQRKLAEVLTATGRHEHALETNREAQLAFRALKDDATPDTALCQAITGEIRRSQWSQGKWRDVSQFEESEKQFLQAARIFSINLLPGLYASVHLSLGRLYGERAQFEGMATPQGSAYRKSALKSLKAAREALMLIGEDSGRRMDAVVWEEKSLGG